MARIRSLKPEFFTSRSLARVPREARFTFAGMWCLADDHGRGIADPRLLKGQLWALDDDITPVDISLWITALVETDHLVVYEVDGEAFYEVVGWAKHQAAAYRRGDPKHPEPPSALSCTFLHDSARRVVLEGKGREGKVGEGAATPVDNSTPVDNQTPTDTALGWYTQHRMTKRTPDDPTTYTPALHQKLSEEWGPRLGAYVLRRPDADAVELARNVLGLDTVALESLGVTVPVSTDGARLYGASVAQAQLVGVHGVDRDGFLCEVADRPVEWAAVAVAAFDETVQAANAVIGMSGAVGAIPPVSDAVAGVGGRLRVVPPIAATP